MAEVKLAQGIAWTEGTKSRKNVGSLSDALAEEAKCGCGIDCCYGYITLPSYNSTTGEVTYMALYLVNGAPVVAPIATARAAISALKDL